MRVALIPSDLGACCFNRVAWPGQAVMDETGWRVELYRPDQVGIDLVKGDLALKGIKKPETLDLVVLQRLASPMQVEFVHALQRMGVAVVVDVDDALWRIHPDNSSHKHWTETVAGVPRYELLDAACALADLVTVSTPALAKRYGVHGRVRVLRNGLPNAAFATDPKPGFHDRIKIGWSGSIDSHPNDLQVMGDSVARIIADNDDVDLHIVGDAEPVANLLGVPMDRVTGTGWVPLHEYHDALRDIDIMLVPLADTAFNRAKSALTAQSGAAAGALVLASMTPENGRLAHYGAVYGMPHGEAQWVDSLNAAIREMRSGKTPDPEFVRHLAYDKRGKEWATAWSGAIERRKALHG
jgi:glycosyltransferase involved in cell wall biosynthesis